MKYVATTIVTGCFAVTDDRDRNHGGQGGMPEMPGRFIREKIIR